MKGGITLRKYVYIAVFALVMFFSTTEARANITETDNLLETQDSIEKIDEENEVGIIDLEILKITAGIAKEQEVTFDKERNVSGEAEEGTEITFVIYQEDEEEEDYEFFSQSVGASGLFYQLVELEEGKNYILIIVKQEDIEETFIFEIDRKDTRIKEKLEDIKINNILLDEEPDGNNTLEILVK